MLEIRRFYFQGLAIVFAGAFASLAVQVRGLVGRDGILPAGRLFGLVRARADLNWWDLPGLSYWWHSDAALVVYCCAGILLAGLLFFGLAPRLVCFGVWLSYLSLCSAGQVFLGYQWDNLLLETAFCSMFFAPAGMRPGWTGPAPGRISIFLLRWLLFRLVFLSGVVKLASGDPTWRDLSALVYHFESQPLPHHVAWLAHQLPGWFHRLSCAAVFFLELVVPFFLFGPRRLRIAGAMGMAFLQCTIMATGNYGFFNVLALVLCLPLLDDDCLPKRLRRKIEPRPVENPGESLLFPLRRLAPILFLGLVLCLSVLHLSASFRVGPGPAWLHSLHRAVAPFRTINPYGLFAVMTVERPELTVEGSLDGREWRAYEFYYKAGALDEMALVPPLHLPRLDWQLWFAALGDARRNPWLNGFLSGLRRGSPAVLGLLKSNPFPDRPPRYLRVSRYLYSFTDFKEARRSGNYWRREFRGEYGRLR